MSPDNQDPSLPPPQFVSSLSFSSGQCDAVLEASRKIAVTPGRLVLIAAGIIRQTTSESVTVKEGRSLGEKAASLGLMMATGLPIKIGREKTTEKTRESHDLFYYADLILREPAERLRVNGQKIGYGCLKEKMGCTVAVNFPLLVREIIGLAPEARLNRGARAMARQGPVSEMRYDSLEEMDRESRSLLADGNRR